MIGQTISHYHILEKLGEGGMGVVYKAEDTKLKRIIALKFLPPELAASDQDKARFVQEAQAASALNHPNVCTIHDIQEHDGQMFIVMEFVDGQTLRERKGAINLAKAIDIGVQVAEGLAAAHEKGIVHRDIKPENIMIRKDGIVQIMDFGLAKLRASRASRLTKAGSTVGTAGYMSPEQVQGQETDHRSDIFSLGVLLYELFTGELPFKGVHETALMYEIVNVDPVPMSAVKPEIDPELDRIVLECLQKEPDERYNSVKDIAKDLKRFKRESSRQRMSRVTAVRDVYKVPGASAQTPSLPPPEPAPAPAKKSRPVLLASTAAFFLLTTALLAFLYWREPVKEVTPVRFTIPAPERGTFLGQVPIISPDGLKLVFAARDSSGKSFLWLRPLASLIATPISGTDDAFYPFWSPDSRYIGFFQNGKLRKIEASGGPVQSLADAPVGRGGTWGSAGMIVFAPNFGGGLQQVSDAGGTPTQTTVLDTTRREDSHRWPSFLPDGRHFVYLRRSSEDEKTGVYIGSLDSKESSILLPIKSNAIYASPGFLLFVMERSLMAQPFDASKGTLSGQAFPITEDVAFDQTYSFGLFSASSTGVLALGMGSGSTSNRQLVWFDRSGKRLEKAGTPGSVFDFCLSPDEKRVVFRRIDPQTRNNDLWILDLQRQTESRFTFSSAVDDDPIWSSDGSKVYFDSNPEGVANLYQKIGTGAGNEEVLFKDGLGKYPMDCSPDGRYILFQHEGRTTKEDLWLLPTVGERKPFPYVQSAASEYSGHFSPDGRWIAYSSDESGKFEVYVQAFPLTQGKWQVSISGGAAPLWSKDGKELFYLAPDKKLMVVSVTGRGTSFEQGIPKPLFDTDVDVYSAAARYQVSRDGKRFLINTPVEGTSLKPIMLALNWAQGITRK
jgi:eukaryotic-like serine/threonine-protein kinase